MFKFITLLGLLSASSFAQYQPIARLHSAPGCSGAFVTVPSDGYVPNLAQLGFDNKAHSVSVRGPWIFFELENFNTRADGLVEYIFESTERCVNFINLDGLVSSLKSAGQSNDYRQDSITFYEFTYFQADEEFALYDLANLRLRGRVASFIVTGSSAWTIYDQPSYRGNAICLQIEVSPYFEPAFVPDTVDLVPTVPHGSIASVRKGCYTRSVLTVKRGLMKGSGLKDTGLRGSSIHGESVAPHTSFLQQKD